MYSSPQLDIALNGENPRTETDVLVDSLPKHIAIAGLIGAGKTTLANNIGTHIGTFVGHKQVVIHYENVKTKLLSMFYGDMKEWGFALQCALLNQRHKQQQQIAWNNKRYNIEDRFMDEDHIFATVLWKQGNMDMHKLEVYQEMVLTYERHVKRPDLIIFLDVSAEVSMERIKQRGREMESKIPLEYLQALEQEYKLFIKEISKKIPVIRVTWEEFQEPWVIAPLIVDRWNTKCFNLTE